MAFQKGNPGRPKGSKNKKRVLRVEATLVEKGINPIEEILKLLPELEAEERAEVLLKLVPYYQAPLKVNEEDPDDEDLEDMPEAALLSIAKGTA